MANYEIHAIIDTRVPLSQRDIDKVNQVFASYWAESTFKTSWTDPYHVYTFMARQNAVLPTRELAEKIGKGILKRFSKSMLSSINISVIHLDEHPTDEYVCWL